MKGNIMVAPEKLSCAVFFLYVKVGLPYVFDLEKWHHLLRFTSTSLAQPRPPVRARGLSRECVLRIHSVS